MIFAEEAIEAHFAVWEWLLQNFGGYDELKQQPLVLPTPEFFPADPATGHEYAEACFSIIKDLMGMTHWPCSLASYNGSERPTEGIRQEAAGLYIDSPQGITIAYSTSQLADPASLIATLAHELCHYLLQKSARNNPPGGWDAHEIHTDIASSFMGFGVFRCNSTFKFGQWNEDFSTAAGWSWQRQGYLSESESAYSLAMFCVLTNREVRDVLPLLRKNPRDYLTLALKDLEGRSEQLEKLRRIRPLSPDLPPILSLGKPKSGSTKPRLSLADVTDCVNQNPWFAPFLRLHYHLTDVQPAELFHDQEFAALSKLQIPLRNAILLQRFEDQFTMGSLQTAIILEDAEHPAECEKMLAMTADAFEWLGYGGHAAFLRNLLPAVREHFRLMAEAEASGDWQEFVSPLDQDERWREMDKSWDSELRKRVLRDPDSFVY